jgi:hypothetical protein
MPHTTSAFVYVTGIYFKKWYEPTVTEPGKTERMEGIKTPENQNTKTDKQLVKRTIHT